MTTETQAYCSELVADKTNSRAPLYQCTRKYKVERDGKPYCTQHDPERVAEQRASRQAAWKVEDDARMASYRRRAAEAGACEGIHTEALEAGVVADLLAASEAVVQAESRIQWPISPWITELQAAIAKAKGVSP